MANNDPRSVADIFAALGLDASSLFNGLGEAKIKMAEFVRALEGLSSGVHQKMDNAFKAAAAAARAATGENERFAKGLERVKQEVTEYLLLEEQRARLARGMNKPDFDEQVRLTPTGQTDIMDKLVASSGLKRAAMEQRRIEAESFIEARRISRNRLADTEREKASRREYTQLVKQLRMEEAAASRTAASAEERYFRSIMDHNNKVRRQFKDQSNEDAYRGRMDMASRRSNAVSGTMGRVNNLQGMFDAWAGMSAVGELLNVRIPMGASMLLSRFGAVQKAMAAAFNVLAVASFIKLVYDLGGALGSLVKEFAGFTEANKTAWQTARDGAIQASEDLINYHDRIRAIRKGGETDFTGNMQERERTIEDFVAQRDAVLKSIAAYDAYNKMIKTMNSTLVTFGLTQRMMLYFEDFNKDEAIKNKERLQERINALNKQIGDLDLKRQEDNLRNNRNNMDKRRDPFQELPNRIPWFMSRNPADVFSEQLGMSSGTASSFGIARMHKSASGDVNTAVLNFNGVPADIRKFMSDEAIPALVDALSDNKRGAATDIKKRLR